MKKIIIAVLIITAVYLHNSYANENSVNSFQEIITEYLNLKNQLADDNSIKASSSAASLADLVSNIQKDALTSGQIEAWEKYSENIKTNAMKISEAGDISDQRFFFKKLSLDLYQVLTTLNINSSELYYQYCPMAKAYWINESAEIINPYFGQKMLTCGSVKSTLKANP